MLRFKGFRAIGVPVLNLANPQLNPKHHHLKHNLVVRMEAIIVEEIDDGLAFGCSGLG